MLKVKEDFLKRANPDTSTLKPDIDLNSTRKEFLNTYHS